MSLAFAVRAFQALTPDRMGHRQPNPCACQNMPNHACLALLMHRLLHHLPQPTLGQKDVRRVLYAVAAEAAETATRPSLESML